MSEHTPGPWTATACDDFYRIQSQDAYVADVFNYREANARLIAAAPELYEALGFLFDKIPDWALDYVEEPDNEA